MSTNTLPSTDQPYVLDRDEGVHRHFLNHLATTKVAAGPGVSMSATEFVQPKGFGPPVHVHEDEDEIMIIHSGDVACRSGDTEYIATAGSTVWLPHGVPHTFQVLSDEARMTVITGSASGQPRFDRFVDTLSTPAAEPVLPEPVEIDPGTVAAAGAENGIELLGPPPAPLD